MSDDGPRRNQPLLPEGWDRARGYSDAIREFRGHLLCVAGQVAHQPPARAVPPGLSFAEQWAGALRNLREVIRAAGAEPRDVLVLRAYLTSLKDYRASIPEVGAAYREVFGTYYPAITMVEVSGLVDPNACVEIEALVALPPQ